VIGPRLAAAFRSPSIAFVCHHLPNRLDSSLPPTQLVQPMTTPSEQASRVPPPGARSRSAALASLLKKAAKMGVIVAGCLVVVLTITGLLSKDRIEIPANHPGHYINVKGEQIRCYQTGTGPDILLIHGLPGLVEDWKPIFDAAAGKYRITAYDRPGHGFSATPSEYSLAHNADVALNIIDQLQLKDVIVVGHSYGGVVVLAMAVRNPPKVRAFVSLGGVTVPHPAGITVLDPVRLPMVGRGLATVASHVIGEGMVRAGMTSSFSPNEKSLTKEMMDERLSAFLQTKVIVTLAREVASSNHDIAMIKPGLAAISKPLHFIHGEGDKLVPVAQVKDFHERFPSTGLTVLKDTGHAVQFAHPEAVMSDIDSLSK
jgi:pimeloyl-ACP methyl ester carboxylesterase